MPQKCNFNAKLYASFLFSFFLKGNTMPLIHYSLENFIILILILFFILFFLKSFILP